MSAKQPQLTEWFPPEVPPVHPGCYQTEDVEEQLHYSNHGYQWWNGSGWGRFELDPQAAERDKRASSCFQQNYWRGLAVKP